MRAQAIRAAYESAAGRMRISAEQFARSVDGWNVHPVVVSGQLVGAVLVNGPEIHACIKPEGFRRWMSKGLMKRTLFDVIARHGKAITKVASGNDVGRRFVERMGFALAEEKDGVSTWELKQGH